ncbi:MAG: Tol-Pal system protein TolB, partial [Pseudomonadota bacterium]|nr:Tol-Pal system protein TolB [Pseudomonadota bacterium]MEC8578156.1 Tol-Pal system protein TolB [Pseudomonadota bacterium]
MGIRNFLGWVVALAVFAGAPAGAALKIDITQGNVEPLPIAVLDFVSEDGVGMKLAQVVTADLERSGLFRPIERAAFIETQVDVNVRPRFRDWRLVNALALVT